MKYIIVEITLSDDLKKEEPVIFPSMFVHDEVAKRIQQYLGMEHNFLSRIVAAGDFNPSFCTCSGKSLTLNLKSRPQDSQLIRTCDYGTNFL